MKQMKKWASLLLALLLLVSLNAPAALAADSVYREATSDVNLRKGAGTQYDILTTVPKGDVVVVTNMWYAEWRKVKYTNADNKTYEGYIKSSYLKETTKRKNEKKNTAPTGWYSAILELNLRSGPGKDYKSVAVVPKGDVVNVTDTTNEEWWKVKYTNADGKSWVGYLKGSYLKKSSKRKNEKKNTAALGCYKATLELNFRSGPGKTYESITVVPEGNVVNVTDTTNVEWFKCTFINSKGKKYTGWLSAKYLKKAAEPYNVKSKTQLRKKASTSSKNLQTLPKGSYLFVTGTKGSKWFKVEYTGVDGNKLTGYVLRSKVKKGTVTNKPYKQVDPEASAKKLAEQWRTKERWKLTAKTKLTKTASTKGKKIATLPKGTVVAVTGSSGKFYKVVWNNEDNQKKSGYLPKSKLKKYTDPDGGDYVAKVKTPLRESDSETGKVLLQLKAGTLFTVLDTSEEDWYWASYTDEDGETCTGFVYQDHAEKYVEKNGGDYCTKVKTELRKTASDTGKVVLELPKGVRVEVKKTSNPDWYYVSYNDDDCELLEGYVASGHLRRFEKKKLDYVAVVSTPLRVQPSQSARVSVTIPAEQHVTVNDTPVNDWYWASFTDEDGETYTGYVDAAHLKEYEEPKPEPEPEPEKDEEQTSQPTQDGEQQNSQPTQGEEQQNPQPAQSEQGQQDLTSQEADEASNAEESEEATEDEPSSNSEEISDAEEPEAEVTEEPVSEDVEELPALMDDAA